MTKKFEFPDEGLKLVCIAGYYNQKPVWRQIGFISVGKNGKLAISLDRTFNPAGVCSAPEDAAVMLSAVQFSPEELQRKAAYREKPPKQKTGGAFDDFDDDIPF